VRNPEGDAARSLYLANDIVKSIILHNSYERLRLTAAGTKVFAKQEGGKGAEAQFRVLGEGLPVISPYIEPSTIIEGDMPSLKILVESYYPLCASFSDRFREIVEARGEVFCSLYRIQRILIPTFVKATGSHIVRFPQGTVDGARSARSVHTGFVHSHNSSRIACLTTYFFLSGSPMSH